MCLIHLNAPFFDLFLNYSLFSFLNDIEVYFADTVKKNRLLNCPHQSNQNLQKKTIRNTDFIFNKDPIATVAI